MTTESTSHSPLPVSYELLQCLDEFSKHARSIFDDLSGAPHRSVGSTGIPLASALTSLEQLSCQDERLASLLHKAELHARNQTKIEKLEGQLIQHEALWRSEVNAIEESRRQLRTMLDKGNENRKNIDKAKSAALKPSTILSYGRLLAPYSSAPPKAKHPGMDQAQRADARNAGLAPGSIIPYPSEEVMRRGRLAFAEVSSIGETTEVTGVRPPSPSQLLGTGKAALSASQNPVPGAAVLPKRPFPPVMQEEEDDFALDLDLNPDL